MSIDRLGSELEALGVSGHNLRCLLLLPQVYVGWASQRRELGALEALLDISARAVALGPSDAALVQGWLFDEPTRRQFQSGFALLRAMRRAPGSAIGSGDVLQAVLWAARAAQLDREPATGATGGLAGVSPAAWRALADLEAWLEVDLGGVLVDLLSGGDEQEARSTRFDGLSELELERGTALLTVLADDAAVEGEPFEQEVFEAGAVEQAAFEQAAFEEAALEDEPFELVAPDVVVPDDPFPLTRRLAS